MENWSTYLKTFSPQIRDEVRYKEPLFDPTRNLWNIVNLAGVPWRTKSQLAARKKRKQKIAARKKKRGY